jgi:Tfp pilus assembly protein PilX
MPVRLSSERGFTTVMLMGILLVGGMLMMATFAAIDPDISLSRKDQDSKQAYAAAESGLQWYMDELATNNTYYTSCDTPPAPNATEQAPVNQHFGSGSTDTNWQDDTTIPGTAKWRKLPNSTSDYTIELLPVTGKAQCSKTDQYSVISSDGNLRLRITGRAGKKTRSIIANIRRRNFIDYIYFTHFETLDPAAYSDPVTATANCAKFRDQRASSCTEIQFADADSVLGPLHTNDNILVCGTPQFGRTNTPSDAIEINGTQASVSACSGSNPDYQGTLVWPAGQLDMPSSNSTIQSLASCPTAGQATCYQYKGRTEMVLNGTTMNVKSPGSGGIFADGLAHTVNLPSNGVIYVDNNGTCTVGYVKDQDYSATNDPAACGNAWIKGSYGNNLTVAAAQDVVINGDLTRSSSELLLGLIANNFVRVYHPVTTGSGCSNATGSLSDPTIQAAILALQHSFIVDNWDCGAKLGNLNVEGAIAQRFRGPVGTGGGSGGTGYLKVYTYNDRLKYREPPYFLDPVQVSWRISRQTEQLPQMK